MASRNPNRVSQRAPIRMPATSGSVSSGASTKNARSNPGDWIHTARARENVTGRAAAAGALAVMRALGSSAAGLVSTPRRGPVQLLARGVRGRPLLLQACRHRLRLGERPEEVAARQLLQV